jgi:hypothetical protein
MLKLRPMPDREKFKHAFSMLRLYQEHILPFVEAKLGYEAWLELKSVWQAGMAPLRKDDPDANKYESAYNNWLWVARCTHDFIAEHLDGHGVADYKRLLLQLYEIQHENPDLAIYHFLRRYISLSKAWAYEMQWITPIEIPVATGRQVTCRVEHCKLLEVPASQRVCRVDCQSVGTALARKLYHLKRITVPIDLGCRITLTPITDQDD